MEDENIFEYGPYKLYKDAFLENLAKNMDKYIRDHKLNDPQLLQDFKDAVDFIGKGMGDYITYANGAGAFKDNRGYLTSKKLGHIYAANYANFIAHKQGTLGNAAPKKKKEEIEEEEKKPLFDPTKNIIGLEFERAANPLGNDSGYSMWKDELENPVEQLRQLINTHKEGLSKYDFSGTNLTLDFYEKALNSLYTSLENGVDDEDIEKMLRLGFKNPSAFKPVVNNPKPGLETGDIQQSEGLSGDNIVAIKALGFKIGNKNWLDANGNDTGIPLNLDPRNATSSVIQKNIENVENNLTWDDVGNIWGPIALDIVSIVNPEPITGTLAGLGGDIWTLINDKDRGENWWRHGLNILSTGAGILPWLGDVFNMNKVWNKLKKAGPFLMGSISALSVPLIALNGEETFNFMKHSLSKAVGVEDGEMTLEDWANIAHLATSIILLRLNYKTTKDFLDIRKKTKLNTDEVAVVKGKDSEGTVRKYVVEGPESKPLKEANTVEDIKGNFSDRGIEITSLPLNEKNIYNPDLARLMASGSNKKTQKLTEYMVGDDKTGRRMMGKKPSTDTPSAPRTTGKPKLDDLRAKVEAKLKGEKGLTDDEVKEVDLLLRKLSENAPKKGYKDKLKNLWEPSKPRKEYTDVKDALIEKGYSADEVDELLKGFFKQGGVLKALAGTPITGTPKNANPWYSSIGTHFMTDLIKSISDGKFTYIDVNRMQDRHSDLENRLGKTVDNPVFDSATEQYYKDINLFGFVNNKGIKAGEDSLRYKVNPNAYTKDTYNEDLSKAWNPDGYYSGRGLDRTLLGRKGDYSDEELATVTKAWKDAGYEMYLNDKNNYYYLKELIPSSELKKEEKEGVDGNSGNGGNNDGVDGSNLKGNNSIEIAPTGEPMTKKPNRSLEPLFSAFNYYNSLRTNKKILDLTNELTPLLYDPVEHPRTIHGDLLAIAEGLRQAAEFERLAATPMTSDGSLQLAMLIEAKLKGLESIRAGLKADNDEIRRTTDLAIAQEKEDKNNRHEVAMKNRENMHQVDVTKLQARAGKTRSDYESTKNFVDEVKRYYTTEHAKNEKILDTIYARSLQQDIYKNPQNYMPGWNTYHDDIWKRGISGKQLTTEELEVFNLLKLLFTNAYYSNLYYNTAPIDTSVKDITSTASDWAVIRSLAGKKKRGGKLSKDDAKLILEFLKESNKNYNKAMDRSARSMYNYIKLLRKK